MASTPRTPPALYALAVGAFGIGTTEFLPMGLLPQIATGLGVGIAVAGLLISGYALGVFIGAPLITLSTRRWSRKTVLIALMAAFTLGNLLSALATDFAMLMAARVVTSLAHGTFFGVGSVVATSLVGRDRHASAIATMFNGLALATLLGVPAGAWLGLHLGWHAPFWAVSIIGVAAIAALGWLLPDLRKDTLPVPLKTELRILAGGPVLLALATTVFGFAGVFVIYTYIAPILTKVTGFADSAVSPILLMFGVGMLIGNPLGGRLADRRLVPALLGTLAVLAVVLGGFALVLDNRVLMLLFTGLLGAGMFATVAPLQLWVMQKAVAAPSLASSLNIGAFNLANALGAWLGSETIAHGFGLNALPWIAALVTAVGIALALFAVRSDIGARSAQPRPVRRPEFPSSLKYLRTPASGKHMSTKTRRWTGLLTTLLTVAAVLPSHAAPEQVQAHPQPTWITTWMASPEARWNGDFPLPTDLPYHLWDQTVRQVARVSVGGSRVRILLSNAYGTRPLKINAVDIAFAGRDASIVPGSNHVVTFGGKTSVVIPPGAPMLSDPIDLKIAALSHLAVSLYLPDPTAPATFHWDARQTAYVGAGNQAAATSLKVDSTMTTRVFLAGIEVEAAPGTRTVVAIGDSITDGHGATMDADARWPDFLARRLASRKVAVLNAGISGARMLRDKMGANALARFQRDVLAQPGIKAVIVLMGINDIAWKGTPLALADESTTAEDLIESYKQLIARAHARGVRVIGATLTPFEGALDDTPMHAYYSADKERTRQRVNHWIRHSGAFDAVIDFDAVLRDPTHPTRLLPAYDCGDHLHPGDAGNRAMAEAINLRALLGK